VSEKKPMAVIFKDVVTVRVNVMAESDEDAVLQAETMYDPYRLFKENYQSPFGDRKLVPGPVYQEYAEERAYLAVDSVLEDNFEVPDDGKYRLTFYEPHSLPDRPLVEMHERSPGMGMTPTIQFLEKIALIPISGEDYGAEHFNELILEARGLLKISDYLIKEV
jgi:hypothetical protein